MPEHAPLSRSSLLSLLSLLIGGCTVTDLGTLDRLEAAYGEETTALAAPALTAAVVLGGLSAEACLALDGDAPWSELDAGDALPVDAALAAALGDPTVTSAVSDGDAVDLRLSGVGLGDADGLSLLLTVVDDSPVLVSVTAEDDSGTFLTADLEVAAGCADERSRVAGTVTRFGAELDGTVVFPAPDAEVAGVDFPGQAAWLPAAGTARWSATVDGVQRTVRTEDASTVVASADGATWPATAAGGETASEAGWEAEVEVLLAP